MITVAILINGNPIVAKNAVNQRRKNKKGQTAYKIDSGKIIWHDPVDGAVALAHKLLDEIKNNDRDRDHAYRPQVNEEVLEARLGPRLIDLLHAINEEGK